MGGNFALVTTLNVVLLSFSNMSVSTPKYHNLDLISIIWKANGSSHISLNPSNSQQGHPPACAAIATVQGS
ncbi:hypothetical protein Lal_00025622 [Lupinus albus]|nr:hypothetical protein Lal_00025622 [Lupinus albus]